MRLMKSKKGTLNVSVWISAIIGLVVLFLVLAELMPEAQTAGDSLNASGVPLGSLFVSGGVVFLIIMAAVVLVVVRAFNKKK